MSQTSLTADEKFLLALYQIASEKGDVFEEIDSFLVAKAVSLRETAVKTIIKHLAQANFIKKESDAKIRLTQHGRQFVEQYLLDASKGKK